MPYRPGVGRSAAGAGGAVPRWRWCPTANSGDNEKIKISDMLYYDLETLENDFPKIKLKNVYGISKTVSTVDGYVTDLRVP